MLLRICEIETGKQRGLEIMSAGPRIRHVT